MIPVSLHVNLSTGISIRQTVEMCQQAEQQGFYGCWAADQGLDCRDTFVTLAAIAQKTTRLRLGTGITHPFTRHPAVTANAVASLDELSGGRAFLGVSAGGIDTFIPMGLPRPKPVVATREMIEICRALFTGQRVTYRGELFSLNDALMDSGKGKIEIWLTGRGPKMLALGGEIADGVLLDASHREFLGENVDLVRRSAAAAGKSLQLAYSTMIITNERVLEAYRPIQYWRLLEPPENIKKAIGLRDLDIAAMRNEFALSGMAAAGKLVRDEWLKPYVIMGSVEACAAQLRDMAAEYRIDQFLLPSLSPEIMPDFLSEVAKVLALTE